MAEEQENTNVVNTVEDKARELGWRPQDEFEGDADRWIPADEFVRRQPLFEKIEAEKRARIAMEKQVEMSNKALRELGEHNKKIAEQAYKRALKELKQAKREALQEGEAVLADEIQERIEELKPEEVPEVPTYNPAKVKIDTWIAENPWYRDNTEMRAVADGVANNAIAQGKNPDEVFEAINARMRKAYPEEFGLQVRNKNKDDAPPLESRTSTSGRKASKFQPTDEQRRFARAFVQQGVFENEAEYYKQLAEMED